MQEDLKMVVAVVILLENGKRIRGVDAFKPLSPVIACLQVINERNIALMSVAVMGMHNWQIIHLENLSPNSVSLPSGYVVGPGSPFFDYLLKSCRL